MLNPITDLNNKIDELKTTIDNIENGIETFAYWLNPFEWIPDIFNKCVDFISCGSLDFYFLAFSMISIWLIVFGCKKVKKLMFWSWVIFWIARVMCV